MNLIRNNLSKVKCNCESFLGMKHLPAASGQAGIVKGGAPIDRNQSENASASVIWPVTQATLFFSGGFIFTCALNWQL